MKKVFLTLFAAAAFAFAMTACNNTNNAEEAIDSTAAETECCAHEHECCHAACTCQDTTCAMNNCEGCANEECACKAKAECCHEGVHECCHQHEGCQHAE